MRHLMGFVFERYHICLVFIGIGQGLEVVMGELEQYQDLLIFWIHFIYVFWFPFFCLFRQM